MTNEKAIMCLEDMKIKVPIPKAAKQARENNEALDVAIKALQSAEQKRGTWVYQMGMIKCDQCLRAIRRIDHDGLLNFCPNCGADMRGEQDE